MVNIQADRLKTPLTRHGINAIYKQAAAASPGYLVFKEEQNVSGDIIALPGAAGVIEGHETHTRRADATIDMNRLTGIKKEILKDLEDTEVRVPLSQAVIYGWYDNEMGNYVKMLGELALFMDEL